MIIIQLFYQLPQDLLFILASSHFTQVQISLYPFRYVSLLLSYNFPFHVVKNMGRLKSNNTVYTFYDKTIIGFKSGAINLLHGQLIFNLYDDIYYEIWTTVKPRQYQRISFTAS
ncbi:hypothetical protein ACTFIW_007678 [Dictyostelium discoideum]